MTHFLPEPAGAASVIRAFDAAALARQLAEAGASWLLFTLGQNSGWFNSPNPAYEGITGYSSDEYTGGRDLVADLLAALEPVGIPLLLYLPCQPPNCDIRAQAAFGLPTGSADQVLTEAAVDGWSAVIRCWAERYGRRIAGWWFDGGYEHVGFKDAVATRYAAAVYTGNPDAALAFNPGVVLKRHAAPETYSAGELNEPWDARPGEPLLPGIQWHVLTYLGSTWGRRDLRADPESWQAWARRVRQCGGALTLDLGPGMNPKAGGVGCLDRKQLDRFKALTGGVV